MDGWADRVANLGRFGRFTAAVLFRMVTPPFEVHETARHADARTVPNRIARSMRVGMRGRLHAHRAPGARAAHRGIEDALNALDA